MTNIQCKHSGKTTTYHLNTFPFKSKILASPLNSWTKKVNVFNIYLHFNINHMIMCWGNVVCTTILCMHCDLAVPITTCKNMVTLGQCGRYLMCGYLLAPPLTPKSAKTNFVIEMCQISYSKICFIISCRRYSVCRKKGGCWSWWQTFRLQVQLLWIHRFFDEVNRITSLYYSQSGNILFDHRHGLKKYFCPFCPWQNIYILYWTQRLKKTFLVLICLY